MRRPCAERGVPSGLSMRNVGVLSCWVWCLIAPSRGGVPQLGETRSAEPTLGDPCYGPAKRNAFLPNPHFLIHATNVFLRQRNAVARCVLGVGGCPRWAPTDGKGAMDSCKERAWPSEHVCGPCKVHVRSTSCAAYCTELGLTVKGVRHDTETQRRRRPRLISTTLVGREPLARRRGPDTSGRGRARRVGTCRRLSTPPPLARV